LPYLAQFFRFARGSMKFKLYFTTAPLVTGRFRISVGFGQQDNQFTTAFSELIPTILHTVKGTSELEFTVPFCYQFDWIDLSAGTNYIPFVQIVLDQNLQKVGDRTPSIHVAVFMAAGEDFQFRDLSSPGFVSQFTSTTTTTTSTTSTTSLDASTPCVMGQSRPWHDFMKPFNVIPGFHGNGDLPQTYVPEFVYLEDLLTRWSATSQVPDFFDVGSSCLDTGTNFRSLPRVSWLLDLYGNEQVSLFDSVCNLFYFNTGSVQWKLTLPPNVALTHGPFSIGKVAWSMDADHAFLPDPNFPETGLVTVDPSQWKVIDVATPFLGTIPWDTPLDGRLLTTKYFADVQPFAQSFTEGLFDTYWKRAGPNFELALMLPVPYGAFWPSTIFGRIPVLPKKELTVGMMNSLNTSRDHIIRLEQRRANLQAEILAYRHKQDLGLVTKF